MVGVYAVPGYFTYISVQVPLRSTPAFTSLVTVPWYCCRLTATGYEPCLRSPQPCPASRFVLVFTADFISIAHAGRRYFVNGMLLCRSRRIRSHGRFDWRARACRYDLTSSNKVIFNILTCLQVNTCTCSDFTHVCERPSAAPTGSTRYTVCLGAVFWLTSTLVFVADGDVCGLRRLAAASAEGTGGRYEWPWPRR